MDKLDVDAGASFNEAGLALQAAVDGQRGALGRLPLAQDELRGGRPVRPFDIVLPSGYSYWLVYQPAALNRPNPAAFRTWLLSEA